MSKKKIVILYNKLFHYRIPIFNILAEKYDLTVVYSYPAKQEDVFQCNFNTVYVPTINIGKLVFHRQSIKELLVGADVAVVYGQATYIDYSSLVFKKRPYKIIFWSIGAPASYGRRYGEASSIHYALNDFINKRADALVFYSEKAKELHIGRGFDANSLFVANNTVSVQKTEYNSELKKDLMFIGTLYLEKGLQILLNSYKAAYDENNSMPILKIVGGGEQFPIVKDWVNSNYLENKIELLGPVYDETQKVELFRSALACISPDQAGLSVLESMGYGVPFITARNAITGGESFNIQNNVNGVLMDDVSELKEILIDISENQEKYVKMGKNAYDYYWNNRTPELMAKGICDAIEYTLKQQ